MNIPFIDLNAQYRALKQRVQSRIDAVLEHGQFIMGPEVKELEERLANYSGARHCITVASGTEALLISLMALDIGYGDEVITTPFTFAATAEMIILAGAKPVFVDIEPDTCLIDASLIEAAITPKTRAIMPVSLYGQVCDMEKINTVAAQNGDIPVIEDAAQSFGATLQTANGLRRSCNLSTIACTSFFPSKPLGCYGDGGAIFTNDDALAQAAREIRVHGQSQRYLHTRVGVGGRMDTIQCAVVLAKLERFDWEVQQRMAKGERWTRMLQSAGLPLRPVKVREGRQSVWAQYTVFADERDQMQMALKARGIPTAVHYPISLNMQPAYKDLGNPDSTPLSHEAAKHVLSLPMHADLTPEVQDRVVSAISESLDEIDASV